MGQKQNEILMNGLKDRVGAWPVAEAVTDLLRRSVETFVAMQQDFLKIAGKQTHTWVEAAKAGKPYQGEQLVELAREAMDNFVKTQKHFMDVISEETANATNGKPAMVQENKEDRVVATGAPGDGIVHRCAEEAGGYRRAADECQGEDCR